MTERRFVPESQGQRISVTFGCWTPWPAATVIYDSRQLTDLMSGRNQEVMRKGYRMRIRIPSLLSPSSARWDGTKDSGILYHASGNTGTETDQQ